MKKSYCFTWIQIYKKSLTENPYYYLLSIISANILQYILSIETADMTESLYNIKFYFNPIQSSFNLEILGFNNVDIIHKLLIDSLNILQNLNIDIISVQYIHQIIKNIKMKIYNNKFLSPWNFIDLIFETKSYSILYDYEILLKYIDNIKADHVYDYIKTIFSNVIIRSFIYGNITENNAMKIFNSIPSFDKTIHINRLFSFNNYLMKHPSKKEKSLCIGYYYLIGTFTPNKYLLMKLFIHIFSEIFFSELRTKYQLGYLVSLKDTIIDTNYYICEKVQSSEPLDKVLYHIKNFNKKIKKKLNEINIENHLAAMKDNILNLDNDIFEQFNRYKNEIELNRYYFDMKTILLKEIDNLNMDTLLLFIDEYIKNKKFIIVLN